MSPQSAKGHLWGPAARLAHSLPELLTEAANKVAYCELDTYPVAAR